MSAARAILWPALVTSVSTTFFLVTGINEAVVRERAAAAAAAAAQEAPPPEVGTEIATLEEVSRKLESVAEKPRDEELDRLMTSTLAKQTKVLIGLNELQGRSKKRMDDMNSQDKAAAEENVRLMTKMQDLADKINQVERALKARQEAEKLAARKMGKMVANMPPAKAADLFQELDDTAAVGLLTQMKEPEVARVLALLPSKRAAGLTERMAELRIKTP